MNFFLLLSVKLATATVETTSTMPSARSVFFDKFNIPKEGGLYRKKSSFDFKQFLKDYNKIHKTKSEKWGKILARTVNEIVAKHQLPIQPGVKTKRYNRDKMMLLLGLFLLVGSPMGRIMRLHGLQGAKLELATREKYAAVIVDPEKYGEIIPYLPQFLEGDTYYDQTMMCWDKVRHGVFWEFSECVTDPGNMMSEVLRFV